MKRNNIYHPLVKIAICFFIVTGAALKAPAQQTLDDFLVIAGERNPGLKSLFNQYLAALEQVPQVGTLPDPQVAFGIFISPVETRLGAQRGNLSMMQMFPWFGTLAAKEDVATQAAKVRYEAFQEAKIRLFYDVKQTWFDLYEIRAARRIAEDNRELLKSFKELANIKFESGKTSFADVLRVQLELNELENTVANLHDSEVPLVARFEQLLNQKPEGLLVLPDTLKQEEVALGKAGLLEAVLAQSPTLKRLDHQTLVFENQEAVALKMGKPSFSIGLNYINIAKRTDMEMPGNGRDAFLFPQVGLTIPLYRKKYQAMVREAALNRQAVIDQKEDVNHQLETFVAKGYRDYLDANRRLDLFREQTKIARQALNILVAEYTVAAKDFEDILSMDRKILHYSLELEKARADQHKAVAYLHYLMGNE